jgi:tetratricopeptide (TPR) repeat protein
MRSRRLGWIGSMVLWAVVAVQAATLTREQALKALAHPEAAARIEGIERLGAIGRMADVDALMRRLGDDDGDVREAATQAIWQVWSRSGDAAIDQLFARGVEHMQQQSFDDALKVFDEIVRRKPAFAEGWNKRATVYFLLGQNERSLLDCDEVLKRNPRHFGALSGLGEIYLALERPAQALAWYRRALEVNPNLLGVEFRIKQLEERLGETST